MQNEHIWHKLPKPFFVLAPMEDVTDSVFRQIIADCGKPDIFFTEFTNSQGLMRAEKAVAHRLQFTEKERPLIAQIWGVTPENHFQAAQKIRDLGFDGIDINMGCPVKKIVKKGACSALIKNKSLAQEIIAATKEGASPLPVSVKTRIGFDCVDTENWVSFLLNQKIDALTIHGRTAKQMSKVPNNWNEIGKAVHLRNQLGVSTIIVGNGDIQSLADGHEKVNEYGLDGIMIGRGIFNNPWLFNPHKDAQKITTQERIDLFIKHVQLFSRTWGEDKNLGILKKFVKTYVKEFPGSAQLRDQIMQIESYAELLMVLESFKPADTHSDNAQSEA